MLHPTTARHRRGRPQRPAAPRHRSALRIVGKLVILAATGLGLTTPANATTAPAAASCTSVQMPVTVTPVGNATIHGTLCTPQAGTGVIQILVPGATYDARYWSGEGVQRYGYVATATAAGMTTLAIDRLGTGSSSRPLSAQVTGIMQAQVIHQLVQAVRNGRVDGIRYDRVVLVAHSLGSLDSVMEAATWPGEATALVLTGYTSAISVPDLLRIFTGHLVPADLAGFGLFSTDPGLLPTAPGAREELFDAGGDVDPAVVAADEADRSVVSATEIPDAVLAGLSTTTTRAITVPVLIADGAQDAIFCGQLTPVCANSAALEQHEASAFTAPLATFVLPDAGHDVALAEDGGVAAAAIQHWVSGAVAGHPLVGAMAG